MKFRLALIKKDRFIGILIVLLATFIILFPSFASSNCKNARESISIYGEEKKRLEKNLDEYENKMEQEKNKLPDNTSKVEEHKRISAKRKRKHEDFKNKCEKATEYYKENIGNPVTESSAKTDMDNKCKEANDAQKSLSESEKKLKEYEDEIGGININIEELDKKRKDTFSEILRLLSSIPVEVKEGDEREYFGTPDKAPEFERAFEIEVRRKAAEQVKTQIESETIVEKGKLKKDLIRVTVNDTPLCIEPDELDPNKRWLPPSPGRPGSRKYKYTAKYIFSGQMVFKEPEKPEKEPDIPKPPPPPPEQKEPPSKPFSWKRGLGAMVFRGGAGNEFQLVPAIIFAGSVGSYFYFDSQYKENWSKYESSTNSSDRRASYDKASQSHNNKQISLYAGIGIWTLNVINSFIRDNQEVGKLINFSPITTYIIPQPDGGIVLLSYSF